MNSNDYVSTVSDLSVPLSNFDVTRPSNFHKVRKTSVSSLPFYSNYRVTKKDLCQEVIPL